MNGGKGFIHNDFLHPWPMGDLQDPKVEVPGLVMTNIAIENGNL